MSKMHSFMRGSRIENAFITLRRFNEWSRGKESGGFGRIQDDTGGFI
jgi:hypothetical protein